MKKTDQGFTLVELLLSIMVLAGALTGALLLFINCIILNETSRNLTIATTHIQFLLEDIKDTNFINIASGINAGNWNWNTADITLNGLTPLNNETMTANLGAGGTANLLEIIASVSWLERGTRNRSLSFRTLLAEP